MGHREIITLNPKEFIPTDEGVGFGTRKSGIVKRPRGRRHYMIKTWENEVGELRSEECASAIGRIFDFPTQEVKLCLVPNQSFRKQMLLYEDDDRTVLIKIDVRRQRDKSNDQNDIEEMIHGTDIISLVEKDYANIKNNSQRNRRYTIDLVEKAINKFQNDHTEAGNLKYEFFTMCLFDALIGGTERHDRNWGIILSLPSHKYVRMTKFFDNGISLLWNYEKREDYYKNLLSFSNHRELSKFFKRGESKLRKSDGLEDSKLSLFEVCGILIEKGFVKKDELKKLLTKLKFVQKRPTRLKNAIVYMAPQSEHFKARKEVYSWIYMLVRYRLDELIAVLSRGIINYE